MLKRQPCLEENPKKFPGSLFRQYGLYGDYPGGRNSRYTLCATHTPPGLGSVEKASGALIAWGWLLAASWYPLVLVSPGWTAYQCCLENDRARNRAMYRKWPWLCQLIHIRSFASRFSRRQLTTHFGHSHARRQRGPKDKPDSS